MRITIEHEDTTVILEDKTIVTWMEALPLLESALLAVGYRFHGQLIMDEGDDKNGTDS